MKINFNCFKFIKNYYNSVSRVETGLFKNANLFGPKLNTLSEDTISFAVSKDCKIKTIFSKENFKMSNGSEKHITSRKTIDGKELLKTELTKDVNGNKSISIYEFYPNGNNKTTIEGKIINHKFVGTKVEYNKKGQCLREIKKHNNTYLTTDYVYKNNKISLCTKTKSNKNDGVISKEIIKDGISQGEHNYISNTIYNGQSYVENREIITLNETIKKFNSSGELIENITTTPSEIEGVLNTNAIDKFGKTRTISSGQINRNGTLKVKGHLESLNGTKSEFYYVQTKAGDNRSTYRITSQNGEILLNKSQTLKKINDNTMISTHNGVSYKIEHNKDSIKVTNLNTNKVDEINLLDLNINNTQSIELLKNLSGEELIKIKENISSIQHVENYMQSNFDHDTKVANIGENLHVALHEFGHGKEKAIIDATGNIQKLRISDNETIQSVFRKEKELYEKYLCRKQQKHLDYFLNNSNGERFGISEITAETNALLNTGIRNKYQAIRAQYIQQYFPETISEIAKYQ